MRTSFLIRNIFGGMCFILCVLSASSCSSDMTTEGNGLVYTIDLKKFDIPDSEDYSDRATAIATTRGINNALKDAKEKGYTVVRFPARQYAIISEWREWGWTVIPNHDLKGIVVPSDITLDLGGAVFRLLPNDQATYSLFFIYKAENVTIKGGHLIGDRYEHDYTNNPNYLGTRTHEWGFGFNIACSKNITINGSRVEQMSGDAIIINNYPLTYDPNEAVKISYCELFDCRRQGISLIEGNNSELCYNTIYNITNGTPPMCGIDIEVEAAYGCVGNGTRIHHNYIYDVVGGSIACNTGDDIDVYENTVYNWITTINSKNVKIYRNTLYNSRVKIGNPEYAVEYDNTIIYN